jgi:hypothetical protein
MGFRSGAKYPLFSFFAPPEKIHCLYTTTLSTPIGFYALTQPLIASQVSLLATMQLGMRYIKYPEVEVNH